jgi:hypothetical protein
LATSTEVTDNLRTIRDHLRSIGESIRMIVAFKLIDLAMTIMPDSSEGERWVMEFSQAIVKAASR